LGSLPFHLSLGTFAQQLTQLGAKLDTFMPRTKSLHSQDAAKTQQCSSKFGNLLLLSQDICCPQLKTKHRGLEAEFFDCVGNCLSVPHHSAICISPAYEDCPASQSCLREPKFAQFALRTPLCCGL
jgi:hypothetical protein